MVQKGQVMIKLGKFLLILLIFFSQVKSQERFPYFYLGKLGNFAILQHTASSEQRLVKAGDKIGDYKIVRIHKEELEYVSPSGDSRKLKLATLEQLPEAPEQAIEYRLSNFSQHQQIEKKLDQTMITLAYEKTALSKIIEEWQRMSDIPFALDAGLYANKVDLEAKVTLHTDAIPLRKAIRLTLVYLDLEYSIHDNQILITIPGTIVAQQPGSKYWQGLQRAQKIQQQKYAQETEDPMEVFITCSLTLVTLQQITSTLAQLMNMPVVIATNLSTELQRQPRAFTLDVTAIPAKEVLQQFCEQYKINWVLFENTLYLGNPKEIAVFQAQQKQEIADAQKQQTMLQQIVKLPKGNFSLQEVIFHLEKQNHIVMIAEPEIWQDLSMRYEFSSQGVSLEAVLQEIMQKHQAEYIFGKGNVIYLLRSHP